jgi:urocanate hydratase
MTLGLSNQLPDYPSFVEGIRRAPNREFHRDDFQTELALKNALRYIPSELHKKLTPEFLEEWRTHGQIYGYRYRPEGDIRPKSIDEYDGNCIEGKAFQLMIDNNLCFDLALYPYELIVGGETGQICQNWMQYRLIKQYLQLLTREQTLVIESGHPLGLFKSYDGAPRVIYEHPTAGSWMYTGRQRIIHTTYNTLLNAGRLKSAIPAGKNLNGKLFVSSGLGNRGCTQLKAAEIAGAVAIIAEVDASRIGRLKKQTWVQSIAYHPRDAFKLAAPYLRESRPYSIAYQGNIVDLLEYAEPRSIRIDLLSDQTSCHAVYDGGYCPVKISFDESIGLLKENRSKFKQLVDISLWRHFEVIRKLVAKGTYFFDYGNSFMKAVYDAGIKEILLNQTDEKDGFIWPSHIEDIIGSELFDYGYSPLHWVCLSGKHEDLIKTDHTVLSCLSTSRREQDCDNYKWIEDAERNHLTTGMPARILYADAESRLKIALRFNEMVRCGEIGPILLELDHHLVLDGSKRITNSLPAAIFWDVIGGVARRSWTGSEHAMETCRKFMEKQANDYIITMPHLHL